MKVLTVIRKGALPILYIVIAIVVGVSYLPAREIMKVQTAWVWVVKSHITLNFLVMFFLYGFLCDKLTKGWSKRRAWLVWGIGIVVLVLAFRFLGDMPTILG